MSFTLEQITTLIKGDVIKTEKFTKKIEQIHFDSRSLTENSLFVAIKGERDGHTFVANAVLNGAVAALVSDKELAIKLLHNLEPLTEFAFIVVEDTLKAFQSLSNEYRKKLNIPFIAITGSNGKTSNKDIIAHILNSKKKTFKTYKNFNNHLGVPYSMLSIEEDTEYAVLELGMNNYGEIDLLASLVQPNISVVTNVGDAHIEFFGSKENIAKAKGELIPHTNPNGIVLLNGDNQYVSNMEKESPSKVIKFGINNDNLDIRATNINYVDDGMTFDVYLKEEFFGTFRMPLFGVFNIYNVLPGIFIANYFGFTYDEIKSALSTVKISNMRFEIEKGKNDLVIINDCYNASPSSMKESIKTFEESYKNNKRKKIIVLGDMFELGKNSKELHQEVGYFLKDKDFTLFTVGNDSEEISKVFSGTHFKDKENLSKKLEKYTNGDYVILFKASRGMKLETIINTLKKPLNK